MRNVVAGDGSRGTPVMKHATYKWNATTLEGFTQPLSVAYVARKYFFYVTGHVPTRRSAAEHDERIPPSKGLTANGIRLSVHGSSRLH